VIDTVMPTTTNKQRLLTHILAQAPRGAKAAEAEARPVLEQFVYALCREGATRAQADRAYRNLRERFFDWNEVRVSSTRELAESFEGLSDAEARGQRVIDFLQEVFETTFSFDLEGLHKKGLKQAAKALSRFQAANDYVVAWVVQQSLGGHAIPLDTASTRVLRRLGLIDEDHGDPEALRASVEHHVPKSRGTVFGDIISDLADEYCWPDDPRCSACPLAGGCPTGQELQAQAAESPARTNPR
jgi:endonuclease-3